VSLQKHYFEKGAVMRAQKFHNRSSAALTLFVAVLFITGTHATAQTEKILYSFNNTVQGTDGIRPQGGVIFDTAGNLYGTTAFGGSGTCLFNGVTPGCGTVYKLTPTDGAWDETILHSFASTGGGPEEPSQSNLVAAGSLVLDSSGNLYGFSQFGGSSEDCPTEFAGTTGCGAAYELIHKLTGWTVRVLHSFDGSNRDTDGHFPGGTPVFDAAGNLYGATGAGGVAGSLTELAGWHFN
jgi:hypothetical protein